MKHLKRKDMGKRASALLLAFFMFATMIPVQVQAALINEEMIENGDMNVSEDGSIAEWYTEGDVTAQAADGISGTCALLCGDESFTRFTSNTASAQGEATYRLSFRMKMVENTVFTPMVAQWNGETASSGGNIYVDYEKITDKWTKVTYCFRTASDVTGLAVEFQVSEGSVAIDKVSLKRSYSSVDYVTDGEPVALKNASFSLGLNGWENEGNVDVISNGYHGKSAALHPEGKSASLWQEELALKSHSVYELHYYITVENAVGYETRAEILGAACGESGIATPYTLTGNTSGSDWEEVTVYFETGAVIEKGMLRFTVENTDNDTADAAVYVDEIRLTKIGSATDTSLTALSSTTETVNNLFNASKIKFANNEANDYLKVENVQDDKRGTVTAISGLKTFDSSLSGKQYTYWTDVAWEEGVTYHISYYYKVKHTSGGTFRFYSQARVDDAAGLNWRNYNSGTADDKAAFAGTNHSPNTTEWTKQEITWTPASAAKTGGNSKFAFNITLFDGDIVYLDDIVITKEEPTVENLFNMNQMKFPSGDAKDYLKAETVTDAERGEVVAVSGLKTYDSSLSGKQFFYWSDVAWEAGTTYHISYYYKVSRTSGGTFRFYPLTRIDGTVNHYSSGDTQAFNGTNHSPNTTAWTKQEITWTAPAASTGQYSIFGFNLTLFAGDTVYLDDIVITKEEPVVKQEWLSNGTFTDGITDWNGLESGKYEVVSGQKGVSDGNALSVTRSANAAESKVYHSSFTKAVEIGKTYRMAFRTKNDALTANGDLAMVSIAKADGTGATSTVNLTASNGVWTNQEVLFTPTAGYENPQVVITFSGGNAQDVHFMFSDFVFEEYTKIVKNGDFSDSTEGWKIPSGTTYVLEDDAEHGKVLKVSKKKSDTTMTDLQVTLTQSLSVGETYVFSYWIQNNGTEEKDANSYPIIRANGKPTLIPSGGGISASATVEHTNGQWQKVEFDFTVAEGYENITYQIRFLNRNFATIDVTDYYLADVRIERKTENISKQEELLKNTSFTQATAGYPNYWGALTKDGSTITIDTTAAGYGENDKGFLSVTAGNNNDIGVSAMAAVHAGVGHVFGIWVKANQNARNTLRFRVTEYKNAARVVSIDSADKAVQLKDTDDWQFVEFTWTTNAATNYADISILAGAGSEVLLDQASLTLAGDAKLNMSFELGDSSPLSWTYNGKGILKRVAGGQTGNYQAYIENYSSTGTLKSAIFAVKADTDYELTYWVSTNDLYDLILNASIGQTTEEGKGASSVVYGTGTSDYRKTSDTISFPWTMGTRGKSDWHQVRLYFHTAKDAAYAHVRFTLQGDGAEVYMDDVSVTEKAPKENLDFEYVDEQGNLDSWYLATARDQYNLLEQDTTYYHSGNASAHLKLDSLIKEEQLISSKLLPVRESTTRIYEVSCWISSKNADIKSARLDLWYYDADGVKLYSSSVGITDPNMKGFIKTLSSGSERSEWVQMITRSQIPGNAVYVVPVFTFTGGAAEVWIDDIFIDMVEDDTTVVAAHHDFHAVDSDDNIAEWELAVESGNAQFEQKNDDEQGTYAHLSVTSGKAAIKNTSCFMGTGYSYDFEICYRSNYITDFRLRFYDYQKNEYVEERIDQILPATAGQWDTVTISIVAPSATYCELYMGPQGTGELDVASVIVYQTAKPSTKMSWEGRWIWYNENPRETGEYQSRYFRKEITLSDTAEFAPLQITADDNFELYVNGELIATNMDDGLDLWSDVHVLDLTDKLVKGKNVIAVRVYNHGAYAGLIFDGRWTLNNGEKVLVFSDTETFSTKTVSGNDWTKVDYDMSGWGQSPVLGAVPISPWGEMYFDSTLYIDNTMTVNGTEGDGKLVNDLVFEYGVTLKLNKKIESQVPVRMVLCRKNSTETITTLTATLLDHEDMTQWPVNEEFTVHMKVELPDYVPDGYYELQWDSTYFIITNESIFDNRFISFKVVNDYVAEPLTSTIEIINGEPTMTVNGEIVSEFWFETPQLNEEAALETIYKSGIETFVNFQGSLGKNGSHTELWNENGTFDYDTFDEQISKVLAASPEANIVVNLAIYAPQWWLDQHEGTTVVLSDVDGNMVEYTGGVSFGSQEWVDESSEMLTQIINHMKEQSYYSRVAGFRLQSGRTCEMMTFGTSDTQIADYSPAALSFFKKWLKEKYGTIEGLREAWNDSTIQSFDEVEFPSFAEFCESGGWGCLLNPETQQNIIDFRLLLDEMTAAALKQWCTTVKEASDRKLIVGTYYGYLFTGPNYGGIGTVHTSMESILNFDDIDFMCAPINYNERQLGESASSEAVSDSIRAYGKMLISEQDNRTVLTGQFAGGGWSDRDYAVGNTHTMRDTLLKEKKDLAYNLISGNGQYLMDMFGGWWADDQAYEFTNDVNDEFYFSNYVDVDLNNDVALILPDDSGAYYRGYTSNSTIMGQYMYLYHRKELYKMGTGFDIYIQSTLTDGKMPEHKINVFFSPYMLTAEDRAAIDKYCKKNGQICVFLYMSGIGDDEGYDLKNMNELTGFTFGLNNVSSSGQIEITNDNNAVTTGLLGATFGAMTSTVKYYEQEIYVQPDEDTEVLGKLRDSVNCGFAMKDMGDWTSVYTAAPYLTADIYRNLLKMTDSHIYSDNPADIVYANSAYVGVHSAESGTKKITLPGNYAVYDVFEEKYVSMNTSEFTYYNEENDTHIFRLLPANTYSYFVRVAGGRGKASFTGLEQVAPGSTRTLTFTPDEGYMVKSVVVNGESVELNADNTLSFDSIDDNVTVVVKYKRVPCTRTLEDDEVEGSQGTTSNVSKNEQPEETTSDKNSKQDAYEEIWDTVQKYLYVAWWIVWGGIAVSAVAILAVKKIRKR